MEEFRKSDYAINKHSKNIVYGFMDQIVEITVEDYLRENPHKTEEDFMELKAISDEIHYEQDRADTRYRKHKLSIHGFEEGSDMCTLSLEETIWDKEEK